MSRRADATTLIQVYIVLLAAIPTRLVFKPLGAIGTPATVVGLFAFVVWMYAALLPEQQIVRRVKPVRMIMVFFWATVLASYAVLNFHSVPGVELRSADKYLINLISWSGIALLTAEGVATRTELLRLVRTAVAAVGFVAFVAILQFYIGLDLTQYALRIPGLQANQELVSVLSRSSFRRPSGTATHPIEFATVIGMTLCLAIHLALYDKERSFARRWLPLALIGMGVPVSVSRSALLGALIGGLYFFTGATARQRLRALGLLMVFFVFIFVSTPGLLGSLKGFVINAPTDNSITTRTSDYTVVGHQIAHSPVVGRGPGTWLAVYRILDNEYLLSSIEVGLVGALAITCYLGCSVFLGRGFRRRTTTPQDRSLGQSLAAAGAVALVCSTTFDSLSFLMFAGFISLYVGMSGAAWGIAQDEGRQKAPTWLTAEYVPSKRRQRREEARALSRQ